MYRLYKAATPFRQKLLSQMDKLRKLSGALELFLLFLAQKRPQRGEQLLRGAACLGERLHQRQHAREQLRVERAEGVRRR